jgi:hypothetical protein
LITTLILLALFTLALLVDASETSHRIGQLGTSAERNPLVRHFAATLGTRLGVFLGILPYVLVAGVLGLMGWNIPLAFLAGGKCCYAGIQLQSREITKEIKLRLDVMETANPALSVSPMNLVH